MVAEDHAEAFDGLRRVQEFINSEHLEDRTDELSTPAELVSWFADRQMLEAEVRADVEDLARARRVRSALRDLALSNNGGPPSSMAWDTLDRAAAEAGVRVRFGPEGGRLAPAVGGVKGALGQILVDVYAATQDGTWPRLKACRDESCRWAFYDRSKNRSGAWCSMAACGNRAKTRAYRRRTKSA